MLIGFKTELKINSNQQVLLSKHAGTARHAWNWGLGLTKQILDNNKANPDDKIKFPTAIDLHKWLVALVKPSNPVFVGRFYPSSKTCSNCGHVKESLSLKERTFSCPECGFECDRDLNASINLEKATSSVVSACGLVDADIARMKQEEDVRNC